MMKGSRKQESTAGRAGCPPGDGKQDSLQSKLADYGELFERVKTEDGKELFQLGNLKDDIKQLEKYGDAIDKLKEKGISDSLMSEIAGIGVGGALDYMN